MFPRAGWLEKLGDRRVVCLYYPAMVTVHRFSGLRVAIYSNDHAPAHVHVIGGGKEAKLALNCPNGSVTVVMNYGFGNRELRMIRDELNGMVTKLCQKWSAIHDG